ncbi:MAG: response regulator [Phormidesmis sp. RL_2_1]|nr:response regulator [Phormidesmis sp. RL_2_1]
MRILLVDDDEALMESLAERLIHQRYAVDIATDGETGRNYLDLFDYDLVLLDLVLPDGDGIQFCRRFRDHGYSNPLMILTAKESTAEKVKALDAGADDYVVKPFIFDELCARVRALLRRDYRGLPPVLHWGAIALDPSTCEVSYNEQPLRLTPKEFSMMELFLRHPHRVYSLDSIINDLWSFETPPGEDAVRTHIKGLRYKLKAAGAPKDLIKTVYGLGYRLNEKIKLSNPRAPTEMLSEIPTAETPTAETPTIDEPLGTQREADSAQPDLPAAWSRSWSMAPADPIMDKVADNIAATPSSDDKTTQAIAEACQRYLSTADQQIRVLEATAQALQANTLDLELHHSAQMTAHKLAGSLGSFGIPDGSRIARQIETQLRAIKLFGAVGAVEAASAPDETSPEQASDAQPEADTDVPLADKAVTLLSAPAIAALVTQLRQTLEQATVQSAVNLVLASVQSGRPRLLIVSEDKALSQQLVQSATAANFQAQVVLSLQQAEKVLIATTAEDVAEPANPASDRSPVAWPPLEQAQPVAAGLSCPTFYPQTEPETACRSNPGTMPTNAATSSFQLPALLLIDYCCIDGSSRSSDGASVDGASVDDTVASFIQTVRQTTAMPIVVLTHQLALTHRLNLVKQGVELITDRNALPPYIIEAAIDILKNSTSQIQVAIADDDPQILSLLKTTLKPWGFAVNTFESALQLWQWLTASPPPLPQVDILVLDIEMPEMNGIELCQLLRTDARFHSLPILFLTMHREDDLRLQAFRAGADDFVNKAVAPAELATRLRNQLARACRA